ncbi:unnamed protein product [Rotaria sp. Silwood1]|nr:unnamed protein product [Rotaria sp. Silwood1]CAF0954132.1 unnamed protein product [Rotaria sp. Silwood1]CAF3372947.1 unnamed protein product [Rotaria sp. Silwood1]CAF4602599.1 unnamed protein product [Rotaria sp. Silwood1]
MYTAGPYVPRQQLYGLHQPRPSSEAVWQAAWPFIISTILACFMIISVLAIGALETASLAISTDNDLYGNTSSTGAGFWCGVFAFNAALLIIITNLARHTRFWATIAMIANVIAIGFSVILLALDAKAVQDGNDRFSSLPRKSKVLAAQLAFAILQVVLCVIFISIYTVVFTWTYGRRNMQQRGRVF